MQPLDRITFRKTLLEEPNLMKYQLSLNITYELLATIGRSGSI